MTNTSLAEPRSLDTRELRALELYRTRGHEIRRVGQDLYLVPSCTGRGFYSVDYRAETCDCPDFLRRRENCKHLLAAGIHVAKRRARDPHPHACADGLVFLTYTAFDGSVGDEVERLEVLPCRRCAERS